jgi:hypothetical protein
MRILFGFVFLVSLNFFVATAVKGQKQLVILKKEKILLRLYPGDEIIFSLKGSKQIYTSYVNNLFDTAVMAHKDIVPFHKIDKVYFTRSSFANVIGTIMVAGGVGYFLVDQFNELVIKGHEASINEDVATTSVIMVAVGLPMMLIKKKSVRVGGKFRMLTVGPNSLFYQRPLEHF